MNITKLNINEFINSENVFISNECFDWCKSNIPDSCTNVSPYYYAGLFFILLGMGLGISNSKLSKIASYICYLWALFLFAISWTGVV